VSRTFGDIEAKRHRYGGNPKVIIAEPEVKAFKIQSSYDFVLLACDGVFDKLTNSDVITTGWRGARSSFKSSTQKIHSICGSSVELILKASIASRSLDNVTAVLVCFKNFKKALQQDFSHRHSIGKTFSKDINDYHTQQSDNKNQYKDHNLIMCLPNGDLSEADLDSIP